MGHLKKTGTNWQYNSDVINDVSDVQRSCYLQSFDNFHEDKMSLF